MFSLFRRFDQDILKRLKTLLYVKEIPDMTWFENKVSGQKGWVGSYVSSTIQYHY